MLKGAATILTRTEFVLLETSLIPINKGCPLIFEVMAFMAEKGFRTMDFCSHIRRTDGALLQTDLLFINKQSRFLPQAQLNDTNWELTKRARELLQQGVNEQTEP